MKLQTIAEHTVAMDLLPEKANILDLGCRNFAFSDWFDLGGHNVITVDADPSVNAYGGKPENHYQIAITGSNGYGTLVKSNDPQATRVVSKRKLAVLDSDVFCMTLKSFCDRCGIHFWDLIKMDIEGSEYEVIRSMDRPYATQITVEFHTHCGQTDRQVQDMLDRLYALGYKTVQHEKTVRHGLKPNWWDSLFVLQ